MNANTYCNGQKARQSALSHQHSAGWQRASAVHRALNWVAYSPFRGAEWRNDQARQAIVAFFLVPLCPSFSLTSVAAMHCLVAQRHGFRPRRSTPLESLC